MSVGKITFLQLLLKYFSSLVYSLKMCIYFCVVVLPKCNSLPTRSYFVFFPCDYFTAANCSPFTESVKCQLSSRLGFKLSTSNCFCDIVFCVLCDKNFCGKSSFTHFLEHSSPSWHLFASSANGSEYIN